MVPKARAPSAWLQPESMQFILWCQFFTLSIFLGSTSSWNQGDLGPTPAFLPKQTPCALTWCSVKESSEARQGGTREHHRFAFSQQKNNPGSQPACLRLACSPPHCRNPRWGPLGRWGCEVRGAQQSRSVRLGREHRGRLMLACELGRQLRALPAPTPAGDRSAGPGWHRGAGVSPRHSWQCSEAGAGPGHAGRLGHSMYWGVRAPPWSWRPP